MKVITLVLLAILLVTPIFAQSDKTATDSGAKASETPAEQGAVPPDSTRLLVTHVVKPVYPLEAMRQKLQGQVVIHLVISADGDVVSAEPVSGSPIFTQPAVDAMKKWKFQPYMHDGKPVRIGYNMRWDFAIEDRVVDNPPVAAKLVAPTASPSSTVADGAAISNPTQITGVVAQGLLVHRVTPVYPEMARKGLVQGTVVLEAIIGKDGRIKDLKVISGPKDLYDSAVGAVQQWRYKPYAINGEPVEIDTTINVNYKLTR